MVYPDPPREWRYLDREQNQAATAACWSVFRRLESLNLAELPVQRCDFVDVPYLHFAPEAQELFSEWQTALMRRLREGREPPFIESHLAKYPALVGRLALVIYLAEGGTGQVSINALAKALDWTEYLEAHARRIYAPATESGLVAAHSLLAKRADLVEDFTLRELQRKGWAGLDRDSVQSALDWLAEYGYLDAVTVETGGRPSVRYTWRAVP
jgi:hypothetical protein